jgi:hypothetical protein
VSFFEGKVWRIVTRIYWSALVGVAIFGYWLIWSSFFA